MRQKNLDLIVAMIIAAVNLVWVLLPSRPSVIGSILALPLVFVCPGYTLTEALFQKRSLDVSRRLLFSLALSLAIDILSGLILNLLPVGLQATSWATLLGLLTAVFSLVAYFRRQAGQPKKAQPPRFHQTISTYVLFGLATIAAILSVLYAALGAAQQSFPGFTQLWMLPAVHVGKSCAVRLGVHSFESTSVTYRVTMSTNGVEVTPWPSVVLAPQEEWAQLVPIIPGNLKNVYVEARLYRLDKPHDVYREVHLTLYGCPISQVTPNHYPGLARAYKGNIHDNPTKVTTNISLQEYNRVTLMSS